MTKEICDEKDYIVKFALTEIETDLSFFTQDTRKDKYLKYIKMSDKKSKTISKMQESRLKTMKQKTKRRTHK